MKLKINYILIFIFLNQTYGQGTFDQMLESFNDQTVPYVTVKELAGWSDVLILDTREKREFDISHIRNAVFVGYKTFDIKTILRHHPDRNKRIVLYCSVGIRSEDIGEKLIKAGYTNVYNLYGGIFEWFQQDQPIFNSENNPVSIIHGYQPRYAKWLNRGLKVYE